MKFLFALIIAAFAVGAQAQVAQADVKSAADSSAQTGPIGNIGNPTIIQNTAPQLPQTTQIVRQHGLPVASAGPTYVSGASDGTCMTPGGGFAVQFQVVGFNANGGAVMQTSCDVKTRAVNGKVVGRSDVYVFMVMCQDPANAMATDDEADAIDRASEAAAQLAGKPMSDVKLAPRCPERLRPSYAKQDGSSPEQNPRRVVADQRDPYKVIRGVQ